MTKQLAGYGIAIMTTLLGLFVLWQFRNVLIYMLISLILAAVLRPVVKHLVGQSLAGRIAWILLYLAALAGFCLLLYLTVNAAIQETQLFVRTVSVRDAWVLPLWLQGSAFEAALLARLPPLSILVKAVSGDQGQLVLPALLGFVEDIGGLLAGVFVIFFLSIYWGINQIHFERLWLSLLPSGQRKQARDIWRIVETDTGAYIRSQLILSLLAGLMLGIGFWVLGSPYPALSGAGWSAGQPGTCSRGGFVCNSTPPAGTSDQCAAEPGNGPLCVCCPDHPGSMGQAAAFRPKVE